MATADKIRNDIAKIKEKITELQKRQRTLENQLSEEENLEIVRMVKAVKMDNKELKKQTEDIEEMISLLKQLTSGEKREVKGIMIGLQMAKQAGLTA